MLRPSKKIALAVEAVLHIAHHGGANPVQSRDIAERMGLPRRYLEQVMQQLVRGGILRGVRGPRGGYRLARERRRITVGEIVRTLAGLDREDPADLASASELGRRVMLPFWTGVERDLLDRLDAVTIEDLCRRAEEAGIESEARLSYDFVI